MSNLTLAALSPANSFSLARAGAKREAISGERAQELLAPLINAAAASSVSASSTATGDAKPINKLILGGFSFGTDAAKVLSQALLSTPSLTHADFSDCIAGRETNEALETLEIISTGISSAGIQLNTLDLSDNALGVRGIPKIKNAFNKQKRIEHLYFNNDGLEADAITGLTELILENHGGLKDGKTELRTFEIASNCIGDAGFHALIPLIERSPHLERLRIATTRVLNNQGAGVAMSRTLLSLKNLHTLAMNDNNLGRESGPIIGKVISQNAKTMRHINLGDIGVEEDGIISVLEGLQSLPPSQLTYLDLSANELSHSKRFVSPLAKLLKRQAASIEHLKLEDNELHSRGVSRLLKALAQAKKLTYLNLANTKLGSRVFPELISFLKAHQSLREIHLNNNHFSANELDELKKTMEDMEKSSALGTLSENDEDEEDEVDDSSADDEEAEDEEDGLVAKQNENEKEQPDAEIDALAKQIEKI